MTLTKTQLHAEVLSILSSKAKIRALLKDSYSDEIAKMISRIEAIRVEKEEAYKAQEAERLEKQAAKSEILDIMAKKGLTIDDFVSIGAGLKADKAEKKKAEAYVFEWTEKGKKVQYIGPKMGAVSEKVKNGKKFAAMLKRTGKKRSEFLKEAA